MSMGSGPMPNYLGGQGKSAGPGAPYGGGGGMGSQVSQALRAPAGFSPPPPPGGFAPGTPGQPPQQPQGLGAWGQGTFSQNPQTGQWNQQPPSTGSGLGPGQSMSGQRFAPNGASLKGSGPRAPYQGWTPPGGGFQQPREQVQRPDNPVMQARQGNALANQMNQQNVAANQAAHADDPWYNQRSSTEAERQGAGQAYSYQGPVGYGNKGPSGVSSPVSRMLNGIQGQLPGLWAGVNGQTK